MSKGTSRTRDMTVGRPVLLILRFAVPILLGNLLQQLYSLVDTVVIGRAEGVTAQAAISSAGWLDWAVLSLAIGLAEGFSIAIAQCFGAGDMESLRRNAGQSVTLAAAASLLLLLLAHIFLTPVLKLMQSPDETFSMTELYLRIIFSGLPVIMAYNLLAGFLRAAGNSFIPMLAVTVSTVLNIALDILFVAFFRWSVAGAAAATTFSQTVSFLICLFAVTRLPFMRIRKTDLAVNGTDASRLMKLAAPISLQYAVISVGGLILQGVVNGVGFIFMAGYSAAGKLQGLTELAGTSISGAEGTFISQNYGAGKFDRLRKGLRCSVLLCTAFAAVMALFLVLCGRDIITLFMNDDPAVVDQVIDVGYRFLVFMAIGIWWLYMLFCYRSALQGMGKTVLTMLSGIVELIMRVSAALFLPRLIGVNGIYMAEILAWAGAAIWLCVCYYIVIHRKSRP